MSRIELDAREVLLRRRGKLSGRDRQPRGDPAASWADYDTEGLRVTDRVQLELAEIDAALLRIAEGRYGACLNCGGPMGLQRLRAFPEARYCVACSGAIHRGD